MSTPEILTVVSTPWMVRVEDAGDGAWAGVRPRDTGRHRMPQTRKGVSGGSRRDPQFGTRVRTERDDHRAATRLERGVGVADETVVRVNRRYRGDVTAS